jgi:VWFA-related protein
MAALLSRTWAGCGQAVLSLLLLIAPHALAQATPDPPATSGNPTSSASAPEMTTPEVSLDLAVRTKRHKPVLNLQPSQLAVTDDGKPIQLTSLRLVKADSGSQHLVTLVFDRLDASSAKAARKMAERILDAIPAKGYSVAVLQENGRLRLLQSWTEDRVLLETAVMEATPRTPDPPSADLTPAETQLMASLRSDALTVSSDARQEGHMLLDALEQSQRILEERRNFPSLAALQALVRSDQTVDGRKFIFYFSGGTAWSSDAREIVRSIVGLANRAGVTIGVVNTTPYDPQMSSVLAANLASSMLGGTGVSGVESSSQAMGITSGVNSLHARNTGDFAMGGIDSDEGPLVTLASGTGGVYIGGSRGWKYQLRELHEDLSTWYQASWVSPITDYDGQFRPITIRPLNKHLVVRARSGYFAVPPSGFAEIHPFEMPLLGVLARPQLPNDVEFQAGIFHLGLLPDGIAADLVVQVPVLHLQVRMDANTHIASADAVIVAVIKDSKGNVLQRFGQEFPLHQAPEMFRTDSGQTVTMQRQFSAGPGVYTLETAVLDRIGNKTGAQRTTFTIEAPPQGPSLSDIALVESIEPAEEGNDNFSEPMRYRDGQIVPALDPSLPEETRSLSLFFLVHPVAGSTSRPALRLQIVDNGRLVNDMPMDLGKISGTDTAVPCLEVIHAHVFPPGDYQLKALLSQDGKTTSSVLSVHVEGTVADESAPSPTVTAAAPETAEINSQAVAEAVTSNSNFVITNPTNPVPAPSAASAHAMLDGVRRRALSWTDTLANFFCLEVTNHFVDASREGGWRQKGTLVELMKYVDHQEFRKALQVNDESTGTEPNRLQFFHSTGEFGAMFHVVFDPSAKAIFRWQRSAFLDGQPVQVFAFRVARANSTFDLTDRKFHTQPVGFHGELYVDPATRSVRRVRIDADDIPHNLLIRACSMSVDYSWVSLENHDFLLPVRGAVSMQESGRRPVLNQFEFRNYHRFGSQVRVLSREEMNALMRN